MKSFKQHLEEAKTFTLVAKKGSKKIETVKKVTQKELKTVEMLLKTAHGKDIKVEKIKESVELDEANDPHAVNELYLYIINNGDIHRKRIQPIIKNYRKKIAKGGFDEKLAIKGFLQAVNDGIKAYGKEFSPVKVSKADRELIAKKLYYNYRDEINEDVDLEEKNKPTNPSLWSKAKSAARAKFDVYPSAYANAWASKWYKSKGGGWSKS